jgi:hypothetical protein
MANEYAHLGGGKPLVPPKTKCYTDQIDEIMNKSGPYIYAP